MILTELTNYYNSYLESLIKQLPMQLGGDNSKVSSSCNNTIIIIIINDICKAQNSPRSKCAKSAVAQQEHFQSFPKHWQ